MTKDYDLKIIRLNSSFVRIDSPEQSVLHDIYTSFKFEEPNFFRRPGVHWDGITRLFNKAKRTLPYGLLFDLLELCKKRGWKYELDPLFKEDLVNVSKEEIADWVKELDICDEKGNSIEVYDYQLEAIYLSIRFKRITLLAATNAGKSLILYCLIRYYLMHDDAKVILVVPTIALVNQMYSDFNNYSTSNKWSVSDNVHTISGGKSKTSDKPVYISTFQSICKQDPEYFDEVTDILVDEAHKSSSKSIKDICDNAVNARTKIGMTGTLRPDNIHPMMVKSRLGFVKRIVTVKELQDSGRATKTKIVRVMLRYSEEYKKRIFRADYQEEIDFIVRCEARNNIIKNFAKNTKNNTLLLFRLKDKHLVELYNQLIEEDKTKTYFMYTGDTTPEEKEAIKKHVEINNNVVILGTEGSISTGISIRNLHNFGFCHPLKSSIIVLQSIGRMLRLHKDKDLAVIFDFCDDLSTKSWTNSALRHSEERVEYYKSEGLAFTNMEKAV
jgi:superfamily II DNA or RNA helicase